MSKLTISEVAKQAGVSIGTVSRALNNRSGVNEETKAKILDLVDQLGFVPDAAARRLAKGKQQWIGVAMFIQNALGNPYYAMLLDAIQEKFFAEGYTARVIDPLDDSLTASCPAFIVSDVHEDDFRLKKLQAQGIPYVLVGQAPADISAVDVDNYGGMYAAVKHLQSLGHQQIAHMTGWPLGATSLARVKAYKQALLEENFTPRDNLLWDGGFSQLQAYRAVQQAIHAEVSFTAIACASDEMAYGAILALQDSGLRVPRDVSVTGFDNLPLATQSNPSLTTVHQPIRKLGHTASELVLEILAGQAARQVVLDTRLLVRDSSTFCL